MQDLTYEPNRLEREIDSNRYAADRDVEELRRDLRTAERYIEAAVRELSERLTKLENQP